MPSWSEHKHALKGGQLTIDNALQEPELATRHVIELLCLAALAPPSERNHNQAANLAESVLDAADLPPAIYVAKLGPAERHRILTHLVTHPLQPL